MQKEISPAIPYDMYESSQEIVIIMPLWWVKKETLQLKIEDYNLFIQWERFFISLKENLLPVKEECYWGVIQQRIDLPPQVYFDKIHSKLSPENIFQIVIPKVLIPSKIVLEIEG